MSSDIHIHHVIHEFHFFAMTSMIVLIVALLVFVAPVCSTTRTSRTSSRIDYHDVTTRQLFLQAATQDVTGWYAADAAIPKRKGYLRRDDGRRDVNAPDVYDTLSDKNHDLECAFLTTFQQGRDTSLYVTKGVLLDTEKVLQKLPNGDKQNEATPTTTLVAMGQCGSTTSYSSYSSSSSSNRHVFDLTASTKGAGDVMHVYCPLKGGTNDKTVTASCHASTAWHNDIIRHDKNNDRAQVVVASASSSGTIRLEISPDTLFTCLITCHKQDDNTVAAS